MNFLVYKIYNCFNNVLLKFIFSQGEIALIPLAVLCNVI